MNVYVSNLWGYDKAVAYEGKVKRLSSRAVEWSNVVKSSLHKSWLNFIFFLNLSYICAIEIF